MIKGKKEMEQQRFIKGSFVIDRSPERSGPGKSVSIQICSSTLDDSDTNRRKFSDKVSLKRGKSSESEGTKTTTYKVQFLVKPGFGTPGAFLIENQHKHEFFLRSATIQDPAAKQPIHFDCRSWVYPLKNTMKERVFFSNTCYLPSQTPEALVELRKEELVSLRGEGSGEIKEWDRVYDYDYYNDLGNPDKGLEQVRPVLGGSHRYPYPRRARTGCPPSRTDPLVESRELEETFTLHTYVPPDERFSPRKLAEFIGNSIQASAHFLVPEAKHLFHSSRSLKSFDEIRDLFSSNRSSQALEESVTKKLKKLAPDGLRKEIAEATKSNPMKFPLPQIIAENDKAWIEDEEFGHQMLAGTNPTRIRGLKTFPPEGSSINQSDIEHNLDGLTLNQAMRWRKIYILDHHDYLMPFLSTINSQRMGVCAYASRTLLFLRSDATLKPVAIELSLPTGYSYGEKISSVFLPASEGTERALWQLAKTHVAANDSAYHQLVSHWLHTHAVVEPFIIATRRQLSVMHPIHRLLDPHFKDTMHINALSRSILINAGGILEKTLFSGKVSMELSSELYKQWRFDEQALPTDLLKRRMAIRDPESPSGVRLLFQDYPYGLDGLDIWVAIKTWVTDFCEIFYKDDNSVASDTEIQAWWSEVRNIGHGDKCEETWWYRMTSRSDVIQVLTTLIWITSALHASVNFGQYAYAGYPPNRPTKCRKFMPYEGTKEFAVFLSDPDKYFLKMLPERFEMTLGIALIEVLSRHTSDEVYLGQRPPDWIDNEEAKQKFDKFSENLREIKKKIDERNREPRFKNRWGPAKIPYRFMHPDASNIDFRGGGMSKGIPNSISI